MLHYDFTQVQLENTPRHNYSESAINLTKYYLPLIDFQLKFVFYPSDHG